MAHAKIIIARRFKPHVLILNAAHRAYQCGQENPKEAWWSWLDTLVYCSLSIEAIGNAYGETLIPDWKSFFESASPLAKIRLIAEHCDLEANFSIFPYSVLRDLIRFRNSFAHAKPENIETEKYDQQRNNIPGFEQPLESESKQKQKKKQEKFIENKNLQGNK